MGKKSAADKDPFARIPESVMLSESLMTAPHAAFRILAILLMGKAKERNGTMMCTDAYAEKFGITSRETVYRSLETLEQRGLIVRTRQGMRLRRIPTLWAVTWWPIYYREGRPLDYPQDATHAYLKWENTPIVGVKGKTARARNQPRTAEVHTDSRGTLTPIVGVKHPQVHTDLTPKSTSLHTDSREYSKSLAGGPKDCSASGSSPAPDPLLNPLPSASGRTSIDEARRKARKHLAADPLADNAMLGKMYGLSDSEIQTLRARA